MRVHRLFWVVTFSMVSSFAAAGAGYFDLNPTNTSLISCGKGQAIFNRPKDTVVTEVNWLDPQGDLTTSLSYRFLRPNGAPINTTAEASGPTQHLLTSTFQGQNQVYAEWLTGRVRLEATSGQNTYLGYVPPLGRPKGASWSWIRAGQDGRCIGTVTPTNNQRYLDIVCSGISGTPQLENDGQPVSASFFSDGEAHFYGTPDADLIDAFLDRDLSIDFGNDTAEFDSCIKTGVNLCLNDFRFDLSVQWKTPQGQTGAGNVVASTDDTGAFYFFDPENVEMIIKVLNGCGVNEHHWVFAGGLTNLEVILAVLDTQTDTVKTYMNQEGKAFVPIQDTRAISCLPVPE